MLMILTVSPMRVDHRDGATLEHLASDLAIAIVQALHPAAHQRPQQDRGVVVESRAEHRGYRQDDVAINHALVEDLAHLADPVVDVDFRTTQAQRRLTAHRHHVLALATVQAAVFDGAHLLRIATTEHLGYEA